MRFVRTNVQTMDLRPPLTLTLGAAAVLVLAGCGSTGSAADGPDASDGVTIVASTNVYGDVAQAIAGDDVEVTSIIDSASQDPHEYEATAQDLVAVNDADVVLENGGGYDPFVDTMLERIDSDPAVITAVDVSGLLPEGAGEEHSHEHEEGEDHDHAEEGHEHVEGFNEHVWYSYAAMDAVAKDLADQLAGIDPDNATTYQDNYAAFADQIGGLDDAVSQVATDADGRGVAITEPVPLYLLDALGLENQTPEEFSEAVEEGADVPPRVLQETLDTLADDDVALLAYNEQTADDTTERVRAAAETDGVPVVDFTETLPDGMSYVEWQQANIDGVAAALTQS